MVSSIGVGLGRNQLITGFGMHHHVIRRRSSASRWLENIIHPNLLEQDAKVKLAKAN